MTRKHSKAPSIDADAADNTGAAPEPVPTEHQIRKLQIGFYGLAHQAARPEIEAHVAARLIAIPAPIADPSGKNRFPEKREDKILELLLIHGENNDTKHPLAEWLRRARASGIPYLAALDTVVNDARSTEGLPGENIVLLEQVDQEKPGVSLYSEELIAAQNAFFAKTANPDGTWQADEGEQTKGDIAPTKGSAAESRPGERETYFRNLWADLNKPKPNAVWMEVRKRVGKENCPVVTTIGNKQFTFKYSDGDTETLTKKVFQNDMARIRGE